MRQELNIRVADKRAEAIINRVNAENPSRKDREAFQALVAEKPQAWAEMGAVCLNARDLYLSTMRPIEAEAIKLRLAEIEKELALPGDGPMEKLLIGHIVLCHLRLQMIERAYTDAMNQSHSLTLGIYWEKRLSAAQKRFIRATENLARVRKLMRRAVTVVAIDNSVRTRDDARRR